MSDNIEVTRLSFCCEEAVLSEGLYSLWEVYMEILLLFGNITCSGTSYKL